MESINSITITLDVLRLLFQKARRWWYHQELRERGQIAEARRRERQSVRNNVERLAEARVLHIGRGGWCLYRDGRARLEGYGGADDLFVQAAICAGVPSFDTTVVPDEKLAGLLRGPYPGDDPLGALRHARALGARVWNDPDPGAEAG